MKFSIIIPTHNRKNLLRKCLHSVLHQNYPKKDYEIIMIDDGSTDGTDRFVKFFMKKEFNVKYLKIENRGPGAARNAGLRKAKGKFIAFTDDDCVVEKNWLRKIESCFEKTDADAVGGSIINPTDKYIAWSQYLLNFSSWFPKGKDRYVKDIPTANIAYRKSSIKNHLFPEYLYDLVYEDSLYNFYLYKNKKKILFCPDIKVKHITWEEKSNLKKFFSIQKKAALGFAGGGYKVHGEAGKILMRIRLLNLFCPRLIMVLMRCLRYGYGYRFIIYFPLLLLGEFYKGFVILLAKSQ